MSSIVLIFFNQVLFTLSAVLASFYLKSERPIGEIVLSSWILGYLFLRVCAVLMQLRTLKGCSILKSISILSIFNILLTVSCSYLFLGETTSVKDLACIFLTLVALFLL